MSMENFLNSVAGFEHVSYGIIGFAAKIAKVFLPAQYQGDLDMAIKAANALDALVQTTANAPSKGLGFFAGIAAAGSIVKNMLTDPKSIAILSQSLTSIQMAATAITPPQTT